MQDEYEYVPFTGRIERVLPPPPPASEYTGRIDLVRRHIDRQGYDRHGRYFGTGECLYEAFVEHDLYDYQRCLPGRGMFRAQNRKAARQMIKAVFPKAKVSR